jgi:hypothetical protein
MTTNLTLLRNMKILIFIASWGLDFEHHDD